MLQLNFPRYAFRIKSIKNNYFIYDIVRKKEVVLTPEEWVRQHIVHYLIQEKKYPVSLIAVEKKLTLNGLTKRTDILVYNQKGTAEILVECKATNIKISQDTFDQIARYNMKLDAKYLMVSNGMENFYCRMDHENKSYQFLRDLPSYSKGI